MAVVCNSNCANVAKVDPVVTGTYTTNTKSNGDIHFDMITEFGYGTTYKKFPYAQHIYALGIKGDKNQFIKFKTDVEGMEPGEIFIDKLDEKYRKQVLAADLIKQTLVGGEWPTNKLKTGEKCTDWTQDQTKSLYKIGEKASYTNAFSRPFVANSGADYEIKLYGKI